MIHWVELKKLARHAETAPVVEALKEIVETVRVELA